MTDRDLVRIVQIVVLGFLAIAAAADEKSQVRVVPGWTEDELPMRADCSNLPIVGDGFGSSFSSSGVSNP